MTDDLSTVSFAAEMPERVNLSGEEETRFWLERFSTTPDKLQRALLIVGNRASAVERYLHSGTPPEHA